MFKGAGYSLWNIFMFTFFGFAHVSAHSQSPASLANEDYKFLQAVAQRWKLAEPKVDFLDSDSVFAEKAGTIAVGTRFLRTVASIADQNVAQSILQFTLAHELWHLRQFAEESKAGVNSDPSPLRECIADAMAANAVSALILDGREPKTTPELREQLQQVATLRAVPAILFGKFTSDPKKHGHVTEHQRSMAIFFGLSRANFDWSSSRRQNEKLPVVQFNDFAGRFVDRRSPSSPEEGLREICNHITRQGQAALDNLQIFDMPGDLEGIGTANVSITGKTSIKNQSNRPIQYSVVGVSGYKQKGLKVDNAVPIFVDATWYSIEIPANSSVSLDTKIRFPAISPDGGEIVMWMGPMRDEALVTAKYLAEEPVARNCGEMSATAAMNTPVHQALLRLGSAASEHFLPLRGDADIPGNKLAISSHRLSLQVPGAEVKALYSNDGSSFATIEFAEKASLAEARKQFDEAVAAIRSGCGPLLNGVDVRNGSDGLPRFSLPRLTLQSAANVTIAQRGDAAKGERIRYAVIWFVQPRIERVAR